MLPPAAASLDEAHAAIELWEFYKRRKLDPSQRLVVEVMMATRSDGLWAASTTGREMPRQNGKGDEVEVVELWGMVQRAERILHTVHDAVLLATQSQERLLSVIEGHADLRRLKLRAWRGTGQQMIEMRNGGIVWYRTRTNAGGKGVDEVDRLVVDEAQEAQPEHLAALTPTTLASANPQMNALGTGAIAGRSGWWWKMRKRALGGDPGDFGYVGHTAERVELGEDGVVQYPVDASDRVLWREANPVLVAGRQGEDFFAEQLRRLGPELFAREHLGVWDPPPPDEDGGFGLVRLDVWRALADPGAEIVPPPSIALDVSPDRGFASFGAAWVGGGAVHVELADRRSGTAWVLGRGVELWDRWRVPICIESGSPAAAFVAPLLSVGVQVTELSGTDHARALGRLLDGISSGELRHSGDPLLESAVRSAVLRTSGDADRLGRRSSRSDITPIVAVTLALGGLGEPAAAARVAIVLG